MTQLLSCPKCGGDAIEALDAGRNRCRSCGGLFVVPPYRGNGPLVKVLPVLLMAAITVGVFALLREPSQGDVSRVHSAPIPMKEPTASATLDAISEGRTRVGVRYWLAVYRNTGQWPIAQPAVRVRQFGPGGAILDDVQGASIVRALPAGDKTYILILGRDGLRPDRVDIAPVDPMVARSPLTQSALEVTEQRLERDSVGETVVGSVRNPKAEALRGPEVAVVGLDESGRPVDYGQAYLDVPRILPNETTRFRVVVGIYRTGSPARWIALAMGLEDGV